MKNLNYYEKSMKNLENDIFQYFALFVIYINEQLFILQYKCVGIILNENIMLIQILNKKFGILKIKNMIELKRSNIGFKYYTIKYLIQYAHYS